MMLDKLADQMEYRIVEGPNQTAVLRGRVLLMADRYIHQQSAATFEETVGYEENGIARSIHSFFYGELKADLRDLRRKLNQVLMEAQDPVAQKYAGELKQLLIDLQTKIG